MCLSVFFVMCFKGFVGISSVRWLFAWLPTIIVELFRPFPWNDNWKSQKNNINMPLLLVPIFPMGIHLIRCTCYVSHEFIVIIILRWNFLSIQFLSSFWALPWPLSVIFVVYLFCQYRDSSNKIKREFMVGKCAALCYIYIRISDLTSAIHSNGRVCHC